MTELTIAPVTEHQQLAIEYIKLLDIPGHVHTIPVGMFDLEKYQAFHERHVAAVKAEVPAIIEIAERVYTSEELRFLIELNKDPRYVSVTAKAPLFAQGLHDVMTRLLDSVFSPPVKL